MKCPKCGFNSFEYYDSCIKCSGDLIGYKRTYSISSMLLPIEVKEKMAADFLSAESASDQISDKTETHDDIFSFNLPDDSPSAPAQHNDDPFNFDAPSPALNRTSKTNSEDDVFGDLLESTSHSEQPSFAVAQTASAPALAAANTAEVTSGPGDFDLESFSWDDSPAETTASGSNEAADDFDSLFGDTKENSSK